FRSTTPREQLGVPCRRECRRDCRREILLGVLALAAFAGMARGDETLTAAVQRALAGEPPELVQRFLDEKVVLLSGSESRDRSDPTQLRALVLFARPRAV
ncbi:MAG TPA: hypothetical protein VKM54_17045, partial [Myxococcota bacterium]|nr:hypothetical protein [Myxococcota bacterium]